jgi:predicted AlkP superfamily phosphohydrolase/phosphomutase
VTVTEVQNASRRLLVIGWDGATLDLAGPWIKAGLLPTLARLQKQGAAGRLKSVLPVLSPAAWTSFTTGVNPGRHGIFDFAQRAPDSYDLRLVTARDIKAPTLWRILSDAGRRVIVVNVPMTYPAETVNGTMITGLGTPERQVFTYPAELSQTLRSKGYRVNKTVFYRPGAEAAFLKDTYDFTQRVADAALDLLGHEPWDFGMVVFRDTDEMSHFFWKHMDSTHPAHNSATDAPFRNALLEYYQYLDRLTGQLVELAGPDTDIIIMSDHGMGPLYKDVYLNEWLRQRGDLTARIDLGKGGGGSLGRLGLTTSNVSKLLQRSGLARFERWLRASLGNNKRLLPANNRAVFPDAIDWSRTDAYSYGYHGQVFLNVKGREPDGIVEPGQDYDKLRAEIQEALLNLIDPEDNKPVVTDIIPQEVAFHGPYARFGADLVIVMRDLAYITRHGFEFAGKTGSIFSRPVSHESGGHRQYGMVFLYGKSFRAAAPIDACSILDLAPTILHIMGVAPPQSLDGDILYKCLSAASTADVSDYGLTGSTDTSMPAAPAGLQTDSPPVLSEADEEELSERLRNLGYLG